MQNNERSGAFRKFLQEKGYYIVLILCILAIGISGYVFIRGAVSENESLNEETLSIATTTTVPPGTQESARPSASGASGASVSAGEDTVQTAAPPQTDDAVREAASTIRVAPVSGTELARYSVDQLAYNPTTRDWRTHEGVDLAAAEGAPVQAACAGTVSAVYEDELLGTTVVITHDDGYTTQYSNLAAAPEAEAGQRVSAGDVIGAVGRTALLETGEEAHLHFAVYHSGEPVDPAEYLS